MIRETLEETGIEVGEVVYHSSQPWPGSFRNYNFLTTPLHSLINSVLVPLKEQHSFYIFLVDIYKVSLIGHQFESSHFLFKL